MHRPVVDSSIIPVGSRHSIIRIVKRLPACCNLSGMFQPRVAGPTCRKLSGIIGLHTSTLSDVLEFVTAGTPISSRWLQGRGGCGGTVPWHRETAAPRCIRLCSQLCHRCSLLQLDLAARGVRGEPESRGETRRFDRSHYMYRYTLRLEESRQLEAAPPLGVLSQALRRNLALCPQTICCVTVKVSTVLRTLAPPAVQPLYSHRETITNND